MKLKMKEYWPKKRGTIAQGAVYFPVTTRTKKKIMMMIRKARKMCKLSFCNIKIQRKTWLFTFILSYFRNIRPEYLCASCSSNGKLIACDTCPNRYHLECVEPPLWRAPRGRWSCSKCKDKKKNAAKGKDCSQERWWRKTKRLTRMSWVLEAIFLLLL